MMAWASSSTTTKTNMYCRWVWQGIVEDEAAPYFASNFLLFAISMMLCDWCTYALMKYVKIAMTRPGHGMLTCSVFCLWYIKLIYLSSGCFITRILRVPTLNINLSGWKTGRLKKQLCLFAYGLCVLYLAVSMKSFCVLLFHCPRRHYKNEIVACTMLFQSLVAPGTTICTWSTNHFMHQNCSKAFFNRSQCFEIEGDCLISVFFLFGSNHHVGLWLGVTWVCNMIQMQADQCCDEVYTSL